MLALGLTSLVLIALFGLMSASSRQTNAARALNIATALSNSLADGLGEIVPLTPGTYSGAFEQPGYSWLITVAPVAGADGEAAPMVKVQYEVLWQEQGSERSVSFETYRFAGTKP